MKHRGVKFLSLLITLAMVVGLVPGMSLTAWADDPYSSLKNTTTVVKFDGKDWYLIDYDSSTVTLLAKECVGASVFGSSNTYSGSTVETYVNNWYSNNISTDVQKAVNGSGAFLLTSEQASALTSDVRKCSQAVGAAADFWWLCSPGANEGGVGFAVCVHGQSGYVDTDGNNINNPEGVRPALKLDLSKVTFDSTSNTFTVGAASYTVTYDANGGSGEMKPTKVSKNDEGKYIYKVESCGFTAPEGETFAYWQGSDGKTYRPGPEVEISANLTLTAQWKKSGSDGGDSDGSSGSGFDLVFNIPGADNSWEYVGGYAPQQAYRVSLAPMQGGSAALGLTTGESGVQMNVYPTTTVYVFPNAAQGYVLDKIVWSLIDGSASYDITEAKNFVMPAMDVVVYVTFQPLAS